MTTPKRIRAKISAPFGEYRRNRSRLYARRSWGIFWKCRSRVIRVRSCSKTSEAIQRSLSGTGVPARLSWTKRRAYCSAVSRVGNRIETERRFGIERDSHFHFFQSICRWDASISSNAGSGVQRPTRSEKSARGLSTIVVAVSSSTISWFRLFLRRSARCRRTRSTSGGTPHAGRTLDRDD